MKKKICVTLAVAIISCNVMACVNVQDKPVPKAQHASMKMPNPTSPKIANPLDGKPGRNGTGYEDGENGEHGKNSPTHPGDGGKGGDSMWGRGGDGGNGGDAI